MALLAFEDVTFSYVANKPIFTKLSYTIDDVVPTAIIGQNGAGKTTLVKLLKGLLKPTSGTISLYGKSINDKTAVQLASLIGLVFQNPNDQIFKNTVLEEVVFGPLCIGMSSSESTERAKQALTQVGLAHQLTHNPYDLSLAERKMVTIASILAMNTPIVIFDEPTIAQDAAGIRRIANIINTLTQAGKLVIIITHDMDFVANYMQQVIVMAQGEILCQTATAAAFQQAAVLTKANLLQPAVLQLARTMGIKGNVLTVADFVAAYQK